MAEFNLKTKTIGTIATAVVASGRPRQWLKNLAIFAPIVFTGQLLKLDLFIQVVVAFLIFSVLSWAMYLVNDVVDAPFDKLHPFKKKRPVTAGILPATVALIFAAILAGAGLFVAYFLNIFFGIAASVFVVLELFYSVLLKKFILIDVMAIAAAFLLRVYAGAVIINAHVTVWFLLAVSSLSLFLAVGKRRSERTLLLSQAPMHRTTLLHYPETLLDSLITVFATATWLTYTMFTFLEPTTRTSPTVLIFLGEFLPRTFVASKLLLISVPPVIYGVMRYLYIIYEKKEGESPEKVLLSDKPLLATVILWAILVLAVIYGFQLEMFTLFGD